MSTTKNPLPVQPAAPGWLPGTHWSASQNQREAVQDTRKFTPSIRESSDTRMADQDVPHSGKDARKASHFLQRPGQKTQNPDQDLRNSSLDTQQAEQNPQPAILGLRESKQDLRETEQNLRETEQNLRETAQNLRENSLALQEGEEWFRLLVEGVTEYAIYMLDTQGRIVTWNVGAEQSKGYKAEEILGRNYSTFFLPEDAEAGVPARELAEAAREGRYGTEAWRLRKDGTKSWTLMTLTAVRDKSGELRGFAIVSLDMTERKAAEEELRSRNAQLEHFRIIVENVTEYEIFTLDVEGRINSWSPGARIILGYEAEEVMGREYAIEFTPQEADAGMPLLEMDEAARDGSCATDSWRVRRDRSKFWASGSLTAVRDEEKNLTGFIRVARDMTRQKQVEDAQAHFTAGLEVRVRERTLQLEGSMEDLRRKNAEVEAGAQIVARQLQEKEVLFREIHHRVKNNLQVVQSLLKMQVRALPPSQARAAIESMVLRVKAMAIVHERLYQMPNLAGLPLAGYLRDIFEGAIASHSMHPGQIEFHLDAEEIQLNFEHAIPFGLLANELLSNCVKHGFPEGRKGTISVSAHRAGKAVRVVIQDNGIGLPADFDVASLKSMGLKLAQSLAHQLGGTLQFTSRRGCHVDLLLSSLW